MNWEYEAPPTDTARDLARSDFWPRLWRPPLHLVWRTALRGLWRLRVRFEPGVRLPRRGPFVLVANHAGHADAPVLMASLPWRRINDSHALAARDYFWRKGWTGALVHGVLNALPIDRDGTADEVLSDARWLLEQGHAVVLFPEGTRSQTGELGPFRRGVGVLLAGTDIPAYPVAILGSRDVLPKGATRPRLAPLTVRVGAPLRFADETPDVAGQKRVAEALRERVRALLEAEAPDAAATRPGRRSGGRRP